MESLTYGQLIRGNRNFRNLLAGQFISELGNWFNFIAGLGLVRVVSDASPIAAGIFFVARLIPFSLLSPIAGTFVDRFSRRQVMIWTDVLRVFVALSFLLVNDATDLWIAYTATALLSAFGAFFDGAKNAAAPNLAGKEGLLAGTALMFSTRFLLMAIGSALGGWAAAVFGYEIAFVINAASFAASAFTVWLIPEDSVKDRLNPEAGGEVPEASRTERASFMAELREGLHYAATNRFALTIVLMNCIWAAGAGAMNIIYERFGGVHFAAVEGWNPDAAVAVLWTATGFGLTAGMLAARRVSIYLNTNWRSSTFIWSALVIHGILFAAGAAMPSLWMLALMVFLSRAIVGTEYAVQETLFQRSLPDYIRGRISTIERGAELTIFGISSYVASWAMLYATPQAMTVFSGLLAGGAGIVWLIREHGKYEARL